MMICTQCRQEMRCTKTGIVARWRKSYCKRGDEYTCTCGNEVVYVQDSTEGYEDTSDISVDLRLEME